MPQYLSLYFFSLQEKMLTFVIAKIGKHAFFEAVNIHVATREWRNWQTRTFEGRVDSPYGFKSRLSHQTKKQRVVAAFLFGANEARFAHEDATLMK